MMVWPVKWNCCYQQPKQTRRWSTTTPAMAVTQLPSLHLSAAAAVSPASSVLVAQAPRTTQLYNLRHCSSPAECFPHTAACEMTTDAHHNTTTLLSLGTSFATTVLPQPYCFMSLTSVPVTQEPRTMIHANDWWHSLHYPITRMRKTHSSKWTTR